MCQTVAVVTLHLHTKEKVPDALCLHVNGLEGSGMSPP